MSNGWLVKLKRTGFESVIAQHRTEQSAINHATVFNDQYQTDEYYVEKWQAALSEWPTRDEILLAANKAKAKLEARNAHREGSKNAR